MSGREGVQTDVETSQGSAVKGKKDIGQQLKVGEPSIERETLTICEKAGCQYTSNL